MDARVKVKYYPTVAFCGKIHYFYEFVDIAQAFDSLSKRVDQTDSNQLVPVSFDIEWLYDPKTNVSGKTSLMQVCIDQDECFLFHLPLVRKLPASLYNFFYHPRVLLHGVNIKNDINKLEKDFPNFNAKRLFEKCIDLGSWYNEVTDIHCTVIWSMDNLVKHSLNVTVDKALRVSSWNQVPLDEPQQRYAATDVFVSSKKSKPSQNLVDQILVGTFHH